MKKTGDYFIGFATENNMLCDENTAVENRECNYVGKSNILLPGSLYILIFFISCLRSYILFSSFKHNWKRTCLSKKTVVYKIKYSSIACIVIGKDMYIKMF